MKRNNRTTLRFGRYAAFCVAFCAAFCSCAPDESSAADMIRFVQKNKESGEYEEGTRSGAIKSISRDEVEFEYDSKGEKKTFPVPTDQIVWLQFDAEPLEMTTARVELQVGNYPEALEKLKELDVDSIDSPNVLAELKWTRAYAETKLALANETKPTEPMKALLEFVQSEPEHYRYYEGSALLGDGCLALNNAKKASEFYGALDSAKSSAIQARGKTGLAACALLDGDAERAEALYREVAEDESLDAQLEGHNARATAQIGLARALVGKKDFESAISTLNALLAETPNSATLRQARIYNELGDAYVAADKNQEAIVAYLHVDLLYPAAREERIRALKALVPLWRETGRLDRAAETRNVLEERFGVESKN